MLHQRSMVGAGQFVPSSWYLVGISFTTATCEAFGWTPYPYIEFLQLILYIHSFTLISKGDSTSLYKQIGEGLFVQFFLHMLSGSSVVEDVFIKKRGIRYAIKCNFTLPIYMFAKMRQRKQCYWSFQNGFVMSFLPVTN